jgi:hypothetical protein
MSKLFRTALAATLLAYSTIVAATSEDQAGSRRAAQPVPTFTRDVAPILYRNCVQCHRAGEIAPMSLMTYEEARPWARAIRKATTEGVMPPWHADAPEGSFENERRLTAAEKDILARWAGGGAPHGNAADLPSPPRFVEGWRIGTPDAVFAMEEDYSIPASGTVAYEYFYIPTNFTEAKWLQAIEVRPGNREVVHHVIVLYEAPPDGPRAPAALKFGPEQELPRSRDGNRPKRKATNPRRMIASYAPGTDPQVFQSDTALRLAPGGIIELQMHYTTNGKRATDRTRIGMIFAKDPPAHELRATAFMNTRLRIPAGAGDHKVDAQVEFVQDAVIWGMLPHTHLRGTKWEYTIALPDGTTRPLLSVPRYDFNWQTYYMFKQPVAIPKGARILSSAWYDNSDKNVSNPDPTSDVLWGDQTWEEMQYTGVIYSVPPAAATTAPRP